MIVIKLVWWLMRTAGQNAEFIGLLVAEFPKIDLSFAVEKWWTNVILKYSISNFFKEINTQLPASNDLLISIIATNH